MNSKTTCLIIRLDECYPQVHSNLLYSIINPAMTLDAHTSVGFNSEAFAFIADHKYTERKSVIALMDGIDAPTWFTSLVCTTLNANDILILMGRFSSNTLETFREKAEESGAIAVDVGIVTANTPLLFIGSGNREAEWCKALMTSAGLNHAHVGNFGAGQLLRRTCEKVWRDIINVYERGWQSTLKSKDKINLSRDELLMLIRYAVDKPSNAKFSNDVLNQSPISSDRLRLCGFKTDKSIG